MNFHKDFASDILREAANFMNKKSTASGVSVMPRKYFKKHKASTKMVAVSLAFLMVFFGAERECRVRRETAGRQSGQHRS